MNELNEIIIVTGKIDTTSESEPLRQAVIAIGRKNIFLNLIQSTQNNDEITEEYADNTFEVRLTYREKHNSIYSPYFEGHLQVNHQGLSSRFSVEGTEGFH